MGASDRRQLILAAVQQRGLITISEVINLGNTSEATARRDLRDLAEKGLLRRTHGGAAPSSPAGLEPQHQGESDHLAAQKHAIALAAAQMIGAGDTVAIGAGTTTFALAQQLTALQDVTVVTNSVLVTAALDRTPNVHLILSGGLLRSNTHAVVGPLAERSMSDMHVPTLYLSGNGLTAARGLSTADVMAAAVDQQMVVSATRVIVLVDHTKIGRETMVQTVAPSSIACVITDDAADPAELNSLRQLGIDIVIASADREPHTPSEDTFDGDVHQALPPTGPGGTVPDESFLI